MLSYEEITGRNVTVYFQVDSVNNVKEIARDPYNFIYNSENPYVEENIDGVYFFHRGILEESFYDGDVISSFIFKGKYREDIVRLNHIFEYKIYPYVELNNGWVYIDKTTDFEQIMEY